MAARREARYADPIRAGVGTDEYCRLYGQILAGLDPQRTYDELVALMAPAEPVLLCYEVPPFSALQPIPQAGLTTIGRQTWCHRRLVAVWFQETLGIERLENRKLERHRPGSQSSRKAVKSGSSNGVTRGWASGFTAYQSRSNSSPRPFFRWQNEKDRLVGSPGPPGM